MRAHVFARSASDAEPDLRSRLERRRTVPVVEGAGGVAPDRLTALLEHWRSGYRWCDHEARIAALPWMVTESTEVEVRAIVAPAAQEAPVVLLLHGWPDSVLRFTRILPALSDLTVVVPALPGFPFAAPGPGMSAGAMADAVVAAMRELGRPRFVISAGDVGCDVAEAIAGRHPDAVEALHLTDVSQHHLLSRLPEDLTDEERAYVEHGRRWQAAEGGYMHEQSTKPRTLAVGLGDSPAGLAAWILEKLGSWTDSRGDLSTVFTDDEALTWIAAYWYTGAVGTSFAPYALPTPADWPRIEAPTVFTIFSKDLVNAPRSFAERFFAVVGWHKLDRGGHFAAWEQPEQYLDGLREAVAARRPPA